MHDILIIDDEADIRKILTDILKDEGFQVNAAAKPEDAIKLFQSKRPEVVILDVWLNDAFYDGIKLLDLFFKEDPSVPIIMISGHGTIETAVNCVKKGGYDFIEKPFTVERLILTVERALEARKLKIENKELKRYSFDQNLELIGKSSAICHLKQLVSRVANSESRIVISGLNGVGKEAFARIIHKNSKRAQFPFVSINISALENSKIEEELFGSEGYYNGVRQVNQGALERAHRGTLLIDEMLDLPLDVQAKLLRYLQEKTFMRVGGFEKIEVDVRVISNNTRNIQAAIQASRFREDLYYRLNVISAYIPALSDRREDIPLLVEHFLHDYAKKHGIPFRAFSQEVLTTLQTYDWPGNVRQLKNVIESMLIMAPIEIKEAIGPKYLPQEVISGTPAALNWDKTGIIMSLPLRQAREEFEKHYLIGQINRFSGNISQTAQFIEMERSALHRKLKSLGIGNEKERGLEAAS